MIPNVQELHTVQRQKAGGQHFQMCGGNQKPADARKHRVAAATRRCGQRIQCQARNGRKGDLASQGSDVRRYYAIQPGSGGRVQGELGRERRGGRQQLRSNVVACSVNDSTTHRKCRLKYNRNFLCVRGAAISMPAAEVRKAEQPPNRNVQDILQAAGEARNLGVDVIVSAREGVLVSAAVAASVSLTVLVISAALSRRKTPCCQADSSENGSICSRVGRRLRELLSTVAHPGTPVLVTPPGSPRKLLGQNGHALTPSKHEGENSTNAGAPLNGFQTSPDCPPDMIVTYRKKRVCKPDPYDSRPREEYLSWDDYFMAVAFLSAQRSKDPNRQVGACIVNDQKIILGIGYNGFPRGCNDHDLPWAKKSTDNDALKTKYLYVCHAEVNAILNRNPSNVSKQRIYVTMFPCNECAKMIIQAGISEVVFFLDKEQDNTYAASKRMFQLAGVRVWRHAPKMPTIMIDFTDV
eukprot:jgi/Mesvir1/5252/Mv15371-RA.1